MPILHHVRQVWRSLTSRLAPTAVRRHKSSMRQQYGSRNVRRVVIATLAISAIVLASISPATALLAQVSPNQPQLGDTLTVTIDSTAASTAPTVSLGNRTYPTFPVGNDRFRALLPTTPLDKPGALKLRVSDSNETKELTLQLRGRKFPTQSI
ncbi:MAG TPA: hypothetical protein V6C98_10760, partial [Thermosynechococcaceae cyanobacterium]